ncbi:Glycosyltransferase involved in cell wall bisynthesis [Sphingomonas sp. OV641]|uniref:glycosyltransferase family 4 protein n=1 Tax=Sphingomonas sp. OV641 TaxID=1881068 RepID=UPI0008CB1114|nr:glycosyltransferase family 1 protein [Sphingomonas sp. OV641]SEI93222.1 Glycosyltransferase involved in cell wall bisynthesis [Sphingomonas sp. OV641]
MRQVPVCIDGRLADAEATGVASYARAMKEGLAATGPAPLVLTDDQRGRFGTPNPSMQVIGRRVRARLPKPVPLVRDTCALRAADIFRLAHVRFATTGKLLRLDAPGAPGIMHWTYPIPAWIDGWINLYTIHDAIPLVAPSLSQVQPVALRRRVGALAEVADRFLTVSDAARHEILAAFDLPARAVVNGGTATTGLTPANAPLPSGLKPQRYFLFCGLAEPRKNLPRLIAAWRASGTTHPLVLTGPDHDAAHGEPGLIILPYQERAALIDLIQHARGLLFPSLAEGFGLPVIEAMALGTPVLTSRSGALAEVAGEAALLVDPMSQDAIADGIRRLDGDDELRARLSLRGRERAGDYTPERFGERLRRLHDEFTSDSRFDV